MRIHPQPCPAFTRRKPRSDFFLPAAASLAVGCLTLLLAGCESTTDGGYDAAPPPAYAEGAAPDGEIVITSDDDFYGPLEPYGEWVEVEPYGRCWRPRQVAAGWRPYSDGHWDRTDSGWYWQSDESWGWATYHYGRWDEDPRYGWFWVPDTEWAPSWVSWREGGGYAGWAPLPPRRRGVSVDVSVELSPRRFVYVEERRFSERVRPTTVIVNNTTIINQTVTVSDSRSGGRPAAGAGPRPENIERATGRHVNVTPVHQERRTEEGRVAVPPKNSPSPRNNSRPPPNPRPAPAAPVRPAKTEDRHPPAPAAVQPRPPAPASSPVSPPPPHAGSSTHRDNDDRRPRPDDRQPRVDDHNAPKDDRRPPGDNPRPPAPADDHRHSEPPAPPAAAVKAPPAPGPNVTPPPKNVPTRPAPPDKNAKRPPPDKDAKPAPKPDQPDDRKDKDKDQVRPPQ